MARRTVQGTEKDNEGYDKDNTLLVNRFNQTSVKLTKAKDHIKKLLGCLQQDTNDPQTNYYVCQYMNEAEQFLSEV